MFHSIELSQILLAAGVSTSAGIFHLGYMYIRDRLARNDTDARGDVL